MRLLWLWVRISTVAAVLFTAGLGNSVWGQGFAVHTKIYNISGQRDSLESESLTLFHAGIAYDYIDAVGEVVMFEPMHRRFTILNTRSQMATTVDFDEINQKHSVARKSLEEHLAKMQNRPAAGEKELRDELKFQLQPKFERSYDAASKRLQLHSDYISYEVQCGGANEKAVSPEMVDAYLNYADWTHKLNYMLHPRIVLPDVRLAVNEELRQIKQLPLEVRLESNIGPLMQLKAQHKIRWEFVDHDRDLIQQWQTLLKRESTHWVNLRDYQQTILSDTSTRKR